MSDLSHILEAIGRGDPNAADRLLPLVYDELRRLASQKMAREAPGHTLQPTALVHEAYLRLVGQEDQAGAQPWSGRNHFFAAAAEAMRRILVENARRKHTLKRGGGRPRQELTEADLIVLEPREDLVALDEALSKLERHDPTKAALVKLRYFAGLTVQEAAHSLGIATTTAERYWTYARAWLHQEITRAHAAGPCDGPS